MFNISVPMQSSYKHYGAQKLPAPERTVLDPSMLYQRGKLRSVLDPSMLYQRGKLRLVLNPSMLYQRGQLRSVLDLSVLYQRGKLRFSPEPVHALPVG